MIRHLTDLVAVRFEHTRLRVQLVGWEHSAKNELILARRVNKFDRAARTRLRAVLDRFHIEPALVRELTARGLDPRVADPS